MQETGWPQVAKTDALLYYSQLPLYVIDDALKKLR